MKRKNRLIILLLVGWITLFLGGEESVLAQNSVKLKFASAFPGPGLIETGDIALRWQQEVTRRTNGAVTFESFWGASVGAPAEHIELLKNGAVQVAQTAGLYTPSRTPLQNFDYVFPFGVSNYTIIAKAMEQMRREFPQLDAELAKENAIMMVNSMQTEYNFLSKVPVKTLNDFQGKKVALVGRYFSRWLPPGATAVVRGAQDRYDLLKNNIVSVDLSPITNQYGYKLHEVARYYTKNLDVLSPCAIVVWMNLETFKKLPPDTQKIMLDVGRETVMLAAQEIVPKWKEKIFKEWKSAGIEFFDFSEKDKLTWVSKLEDIPAEWAAEMDGMGLPGSKIVQRWQEITGQMGHKWLRKWGVKK
jgi:TRAP-type C4-dicarboxylate transport system substrate-binding protein